MLLNLIAFDPGGETGVAWAVIRENDSTPLHSQILMSTKHGLGGAWQIQMGGDPKDHALAGFETILECEHKAGAGGRQEAYKVRTVVVCEDFIPPASRARKKSVLLPVKIAAMLGYHVWLENLAVEWRWQQPQERSVITDDMLRKWKLWQPGKANDDAMAALKHLIVLARKLDVDG